MNDHVIEQHPRLASPFDPSRDKKSPRDYATAVQLHSQRSHRSHLFTGTNYRSLASFLFGTRNQLPLNQDIPQPRNHDYLVIHDLTSTSRTIATFDSITGLDAFSSHPLPARGCGQLLFIRGHPSRDWVNGIGARYRVDPELFRRQLSLDFTQDAFDLPGPASSSMNIANLTFTSIGRRDVSITNFSRDPKALPDYAKKLGTSAGLVGESIVRKFSVHDEEHFSIEQDVNISVLRRGEGWAALIVLDSGRDLDEGPRGPWHESLFAHKTFEDVFSPVIRFEPRVCFRPPDGRETAPAPTSSAAHPRRPFFQNSSLLPGEDYGQYLHPATMRADPFYALHDVFAFVASSENQFLNMLKSKYDSSTRRIGDINQLEDLLRKLKYHNDILHDHLEQLQNIVECIENRTDLQSLRPRPLAPASKHLRLAAQTYGYDNPDVTLERDIQRADQAAATLLRDFNRLTRKSRQLLQLHNDGIEEIRTGIMLAESRKATEQAGGVARLTFLAFLFIPLSFTTSLFGMNVREIGKDLSIWVWVVVSVPVFMFAVVCYSWANITKLAKYSYTKMR